MRTTTAPSMKVKPRYNEAELAKARKALSLLKEQKSKGVTAAQRIEARQFGRQTMATKANGNYRKVFNPNEIIKTKATAGTRENVSEKYDAGDNERENMDEDQQPVIPSKHFDQPFGEPVKAPLNTQVNRQAKPAAATNNKVGATPVKDERPIKVTAAPEQPEAEGENEYEQISTVACRYCERKFNPSSLAKHAKVCEMRPDKPKRKAFNSSKARVADPDQAQLVAETKPEQKKLKTTKKVAKWKAQSQNFRKAICNGKDVPKEGEPGAAVNEPDQPEDDFVKCETCGRTFNTDAGKKHVPFCANRLKMEQLKNPQKFKNGQNPLMKKK